jgi:glycosyltransferase involved in cell wall biosynthesis
MRLGFYYHIPATIQLGKIYVPGYLGRFLDELANNIEHLTLFLHQPNPGENVNFDHVLQASNIDLVRLPQRKSAPYRLLYAKKYTMLIKQHSKNIDALMLRGPSPLLPSLANADKSLPIILMIVGDYLAGIDSLPQPAWRKTLIRLMETVNYHEQLKVARRSLVFVNSKILFDQYNGIAKKLFETRTTTLAKDDFFVRENTCENRPIHLLYTGRMDPSKGLLDMVKALSLLVQQGEDVVLDFVGWSEANSDILDQINSTAKQAGVDDRVIYYGYKPVGPELFAYYKIADIYLIASQASEGFPRTIWEAMANSLPVVATRVGSIPDFIEGAAELVEPKNLAALVEGIKRVISDPLLRRSNIEKGFQLASQNTLEIQVQQMAEKIQAWVEQQNE